MKTDYEAAREAATEGLKKSMRILERKMLFGIEKVFTMAVAVDPSCRGCHGVGIQYSNTVPRVCHCVSSGEVVDNNGWPSDTTEIKET